jgi:hypothetical protein
MFVVQEYLLGEWSDFYSSEDRKIIDNLYEKLRCQTPRRVRLIERTETVLQLDNKYCSKEYGEFADKKAKAARLYEREVVKECW